MYWDSSGFALGGFRFGGFCIRGKGLYVCMYMYICIHMLCIRYVLATIVALSNLQAQD